MNYLYPNNVRAFVGCRQIEGCYNENADYIMGTKGVLTIGRGPLPRIEGQTNWTFEGQKNDMYQHEHDVLFASIRKGEPINDGERMATSTLLGIMGRMAAYTGQAVTWEQAMNSQEHIFPEKLDWNGSLAGRSDGPSRHYKAGIAICDCCCSFRLAADFLSAAVDFDTQIRPILPKECIVCHSAERGVAACGFTRAGGGNERHRCWFPANRRRPGCTWSWR